MQAVMRAWLPLSRAVLGAVARSLPSPVEAQRFRVDKLWPVVGADDGCAPNASALALREGMPLSDRLARTRAAVAACDGSDSADVVVFVSKMFAVPTASLPEPAPPAGSPPGAAFPSSVAPVPPSAWWGMHVVATAQELRGVHAAGRRALLRPTTAQGAEDVGALMDDSMAARSVETAMDASDAEPSAVETFVAFARVLAGVLRPDSAVFVLGPKYDPSYPAASGWSNISQVCAQLV